MAPPNTKRKLKRNNVDCTMPMANRPGVRKYFRKTRRVTSMLARDIPGALTGVAIVWLIVPLSLLHPRSPGHRRGPL
jgi:hypothetical protein